MLRSAPDTEGGRRECGETNTHVDGTRLDVLQSVAAAAAAAGEEDNDDEEEDDDDDDDLGDEELAPIRLHIC